MFCPICGKKSANATEQVNHENEHSDEEKAEFLQEQKRRNEEIKNQKENHQQLPEIISFSQGPNFSKIYATQWGLSLTDMDIRIDIFNERVNHPPKIDPRNFTYFQPVEYIIESQVITPIVSAKTLYIKLGELITHYEENVGPISERV
tara:strand:+ start:266 stop:709 length:444 start_codon:yes stop_codon:yes gene_type:complete